MTFAILAALSALLWFPSRYYLPETKIEVNSRALQPARLWRNYKRPLAAPDFLLCTTLSGCSIGVVYTALIGAPNLVLNVLGMGTLAIVIVAIAALIGFAVGAVPSTLLNKRVRDIYRVIADLCVLLTGSFTLLSVAVFIGKRCIGNVSVPIAFCFTSVGLVVPVSTARAMTPFDYIAGTASSVLGFTRMALLQPKSESTSHRASRFTLSASYKGSARPSLPHSVVSRRRQFQALKPDGSIWVSSEPKCSQPRCSAIRSCSC